MAYRVYTKKDKMPQGKYEGKTINWLMKYNPKYLLFLMEKTSMTRFSIDLENEIKKLAYETEKRTVS